MDRGGRKWQEGGEDCIMMSFATCSTLQLLLGRSYEEGWDRLIMQQAREMENEYKILVGNPKGRDCSEDLDVDGRIIQAWLLGKQGGKV
jgi:hypothetical protein